MYNVSFCIFVLNSEAHIVNESMLLRGLILTVIIICDKLVGMTFQ